MNETYKIFKVIFLHPVFQNIAIIATVALALINAYSAAKLAPLAATQAAIVNQVQAFGARLNEDEKYIPDFIKTQAQVTAQADQLNRIETRVDGIDSFLRGYK